MYKILMMMNRTLVEEIKVKKINIWENSTEHDDAIKHFATEKIGF